MQVQKEWQLLEEVVGVALLRLEDRLREPSGDDATSRPTCRSCRSTRSCWSRCSSTCSRMRPSTRRPARRSRSAPRRATGEVVVDVADRGPGLPPGEEERIFEKFHRGSQRAGRGVGLGLTICRGIVHGARRADLGRDARRAAGRVFRFTLPLAGTPPTLAAEANGAQPSRERQRRPPPRWSC